MMRGVKMGKSVGGPAHATKLSTTASEIPALETEPEVLLEIAGRASSKVLRL